MFFPVSLEHIMPISYNIARELVGDSTFNTPIANNDLF